MKMQAHNKNWPVLEGLTALILLLQQAPINKITPMTKLKGYAFQMQPKTTKSETLRVIMQN